MEMPPYPRSVAPAGRAVLDHALVILRPLVAWLLRSGVGYGEFAAALKPVFLDMALAEVARDGAKLTDSALSLLSGLHRDNRRMLGKLAVVALAGLCAMIHYGIRAFEIAEESSDPSSAEPAGSRS